jgi:CubicO group peptidase (beta-lactamase class C family)
LPTSLPETEGISLDPLTQMTNWVQTNPSPIFSILISRHGKLVYELYTSQLTRDHAHYLMSVTKSFLSSLVGIALDQGLIGAPDESIGKSLPRVWFKSDADQSRMQPLTLKDVMGMSALDCPDPPRDTSPASEQRQAEFLSAPNRASVALDRPLLATMGSGFQYNDENPQIASGVLAAASGQAPFDFANRYLFGPLGFQHQEWMHQDTLGNDMGGYGLRLRPIDLQKFGNLFLNQGTWQGKRLISSAWVQTSFTPWNKSVPTAMGPDYGWFWWRFPNQLKWAVKMANGWRGQRIFVLPDQELVVTITADIEDGSEVATIARLMNTWILPAVQSAPLPVSTDAENQLAELMAQVRAGSPRWAKTTEPRMIPSVAPKGKRLPFHPPKASPS